MAIVLCYLTGSTPDLHGANFTILVVATIWDSRYITNVCDSCGIKAIDGQAFPQERLPFRRARSYCPACHRRFYERFYIGLSATLLIIFGSYVFNAIRRGQPVLGEAPIFLLVLLLQYPLIILHELGHASFARAFGYESIRVLIGSGKTLFHLSFLSFTWFVNLIPFGGLTYATPRGPIIRAQWLLYIAGGLIVNLALLLAAWIAWRSNLVLFAPNILPALILANALVIAENILPYTVRTPFGLLSTDGKLLVNALFRWNKPPLPQRAPGKLARLTFVVLKVLAALLLFGCGLIFLAMPVAFFVGGGLRGDLVVRVSLSLFMFALGSILFWYAWRIFREPLHGATGTNRPLAWWDQLRSTSTANSDDLAVIQTHSLQGDFQSALHLNAQLLEQHPQDTLLIWTQADLLLAANEAAAAERACDRLLSELAARDPSRLEQPGIYFDAVTKRLHAIMLQNDGRFENECNNALQQLVSDQSKITLLDQLACIPLFQELAHLYPLSEFCIRKAIELGPALLTLRGTLGGLLAERGHFAEAEPHLRACYDGSAALHDRGICSYYLALLAENQGDRARARKLARDSIALHPELWLKQKAERLLARAGR